MATYTSAVRAVETAAGHPFVLDSIDRTPSPTHSDETNWHRYVINQGRNQIVGYRRGTEDSVRRDVDLIVEQLNARRFLQSGRRHITIGQPKKKA